MISWVFQVLFSNFYSLFKKCYIIEPRKIFKTLLYALLLSCRLMKKSQSTSEDICLSYRRTSLFIFHRFINIYALCFSPFVVLEITNIVKLSDISFLNIPVFISISRKLLVFMWCCTRFRNFSSSQNHRYIIEKDGLHISFPICINFVVKWI